MKNQICSCKRAFPLLFLLLLGMSSFAQVQQEVPLFKSTRTFVHKAVRKDTVWTPGAIVDQIYFARYDKQGRISVENLLNPDGSAKTKLIYVYDKNNRIREEITASVKQRGIKRIYRYSYDEQGRVNGKTVLDADRNIVLKDTILRDKEGRVVLRTNESVSTRLNDGKRTKNLREVEIVYGQDGKITDVLEEDSQFPKLGRRSRALEKGDTIPLKRFSDTNSMKPRIPKNKKVDFDYDIYGSWVKRTEYDGINPEFIVVRTIEYAGQDSDCDKMLLKGQVKSVLQASYAAIPKGPGSIDKGKKEGVFFRCKFDDKGRKVLEQVYSETGIPGEITEYKYDERGNIQEELRKSSDGKALNSVQWKYDSSGDLKNKVLTDMNGEVQRKGVFRYDIEGNCINEVWFNKDGSKFSEFRYQYDPMGQLMAKDVLFHQEEGAEYVPLKRVWNNRGRIVEELKGLPQDIRRYIYKYSTSGEVISGTEPVDGQSDVGYVYKFYNDEYGNWKKRVKFINDVPVLYEEREYVYYQ